MPLVVMTGCLAPHDVQLAVRYLRGGYLHTRGVVPIVGADSCVIWK